jgi:hypothetical protein
MTSVLKVSFVQSTTRVKPFICTMPMRLDDGWNQIQFNLSDFTRRAYGAGCCTASALAVLASYTALLCARCSVMPYSR